MCCSYTSRVKGRVGGTGVRIAPLREIMDMADTTEPLTYFVETMG